MMPGYRRKNNKTLDISLYLLFSGYKTELHDKIFINNLRLVKNGVILAYIRVCVFRHFN